MEIPTKLPTGVPTGMPCGVPIEVPLMVKNSGEPTGDLAVPPGQDDLPPEVRCSLAHTYR